MLMLLTLPVSVTLRAALFPRITCVLTAPATYWRTA
jgi:hypothetical protein